METSIVYRTKKIVIIQRLLYAIVAMVLFFKLDFIDNTIVHYSLLLITGTAFIYYLVNFYKCITQQYIISEKSISSKNALTRNISISWNDIKTVNIVLSKGLIRINGSGNQIVIKSSVEKMDNLIHQLIKMQGADKINYGDL